MRRLLLALAERGEPRAHRLRWSRWPRAHQARVNRCHAARRTRERALRLETAAPQREPPPLVELTEAEWGRLRPLLPPPRPRTGRPRNDHRAVLGGILWGLRNRASWRALPARFGNHSTVYTRHRRWSETGLWERLLSVLRSVTDEGAADVSL